MKKLESQIQDLVEIIQEHGLASKQTNEFVQERENPELTSLYESLTYHKANAKSEAKSYV